MTFGRDLGHNAAQIRQRGGFILAWKRDSGVRASPAAIRKASCYTLWSSSSQCRINSTDVSYWIVMHTMRRAGAAKSSLSDDPSNSPGQLLGGQEFEAVLASSFTGHGD